MDTPLANRAKAWRFVVIIVRISIASAGFVLLRALVHRLGLDVLELSPLLSSLVAATVFLLGFLLKGVLSDYKESEKLPGELSTSLFLLAKEIKAIPITLLALRSRKTLGQFTTFASALFAGSKVKLAPIRSWLFIA
jgi:hypothetical protein